MAIMPEVIIHHVKKGTERTAIIAKSNYDGKPVLAFESIEQARRYVEKCKQTPRVTWYKQTISEEEVQISI